MSTVKEEVTPKETPEWLIQIAPFLSLLLGGGALWYTWYKYNELMGDPAADWFQWIRPTFAIVIGLSCLVAFGLFLVRNSAAWAVFTWGLLMVPLLLFVNLIIFVVRIIVNIVQGDAQPIIEKIFEQPGKFVAIPLVILALALLNMISKGDKNKK